MDSFQRSATARAAIGIVGQQRRQPQQRIGREEIARVDGASRSSRAILQFAGQNFAREFPHAAITRSTGAGFSASSSRSISFWMRSPESLREPGFLRRRCVQRVGIDLALAVPGMKAEQAQDAQIILADARGRIADETHAARLQIGDAADIIEHFAVRVRVKRVHGEVAALRVFRPIGGEGDDGAAAIGRDIAAQRRDLERLAARQSP